MTAASKVLVIEDDASIRTALRAVLDRCGCEVVEAAAGLPGVALALEDATIDLIIVDIGLPDIDGWEVLARIRPRTMARLVVLTAGGAGEQEALDRGLDIPVLAKPFRLATIRAVVAGEPLN
jgi:two-component system KDP operon response regulator KdpE